MTDSDYIEKIDMAWPRSIAASATEALRLVEEGLSAFPKCAKLWCMKGDLIQAGTNKRSMETGFQEMTMPNPAHALDVGIRSLLHIERHRPAASDERCYGEVQETFKAR